MFGIFNFKIPVVGIYDGASGLLSWSNPQTGGVLVLNENIKVAKFFNNNTDVLKLFANGVENIDYVCVFVTYRKIMTKAVTFVKKTTPPFPDHVYPYGKLSSILYKDPYYNLTKIFVGRESLFYELKPSFTGFLKNLRTTITDGSITDDLGTIGFNGGLFSKQTPLSKALVQFLYTTYSKQGGKFDVTLLRSLGEAITGNTDDKAVLVGGITKKI